MHMFSEDDNIDYEKEAIPREIKVCIASDLHMEKIRIYFLVLNVMQYVLPVFSLFITYSIITYKFRFVNAKDLENDENKSNNILRRKRENKVNFNFKTNNLIKC